MARLLSNEGSISAVTAKIIDIILKMPFEHRRRLLDDLSESRGINSRKYNRKECLMDVQYASNNRIFNGFINNISSRGAFIECPKETLKRLSFGQPVTLTFNHPDQAKPVKATGEVARIADSGFGISFDDFLQGIEAAA
jgi:hypothetical protein